MILRKEFYFVRHGQTDHNLSREVNKGDHPVNIPLNATGRLQAQAIAPIIASLPIQTVCCSPTMRTQETKAIITAQLQTSHYTIDDLSECSMEIWKELSTLEATLDVDSTTPLAGKTHLFIDQVRNGMNHALSLPGPSLIVAHGGIHWATCYLMRIEEHDWSIDNCGIVHFSIGPHGKWVGKRLT